MRSVAYIRVSTMKEEQALSLKNQQDFFQHYIVNRGDELIQIYSDQGKSATKMQNRDALNRMIKDAKLGKFEKIYAKDISRIFRNTLDFITFTRELMDRHGIKLHLVNFGEGQDIDAFTLGLMAMIAEHESKKISERVKFGKTFSKENGIVPNFVFGYERADKYTLLPNGDSQWVMKIFDLYTEANWGEARIAQYLCEHRIKTSKRKNGEPNYDWSAKTVNNILKNQIYIGRVINGKQTSQSLYSGKRMDKDEEDWVVVEKPAFRLISDAQFLQAQERIEKNKILFPSIANGRRSGTRRSETLLYSNLLACSCCGSAYRRYRRQHVKDGPIYAWWVCGGRSKYGAAKCNAAHIRIDEAALTTSLGNLFGTLITDKTAFFQLIEAKAQAQMKAYIDQNAGIDIAETKTALTNLQEQHTRIKIMVQKGMLDIDEGEVDMKDLNKQMERLRNIIAQKDVSADLSVMMKRNLAEFIHNFSNASFTEGLDNASLKMIAQKITVLGKNEMDIQFISNDADNNAINVRLPLGI